MILAVPLGAQTSLKTVGDYACATIQVCTTFRFEVLNLRNLGHVLLNPKTHLFGEKSTCFIADEQKSHGLGITRENGLVPTMLG